MRLTSKQISVVQKIAQKLIPYEGSKIYLFGSRVDDTQKGGDIDLLFEIPNFLGDGFRLQMNFITEYSKHLDEEKIDITIYDPESQKDSSVDFVKAINEKTLLWKK